MYKGVHQERWVQAGAVGAADACAQEEEATRKPLDTPEVQAAPSSSEEEALPPATPLRVIQAVCQSLGIAPEKLSEDRLMEDPDVPKPAPTDD